MKELTKAFFERYGAPYETSVNSLTDVWYRVEMMPEREGCGLAISFSEWYIDGTKFNGFDGDEFPTERDDLTCRAVDHFSDGSTVPHFYSEEGEGTWVRYTELGTEETERWTYDG